MDEMIGKLQTVLDEAVASGAECGCQLTVYRHGKLVCDLAAGWTDAEKTRKVTPTTLFPVFSVGKGILTTLFHVCAAKGWIDYDAPVVQYWPEYGANGKEATKVWHLLSHRAGLYEYPAGHPFFERFDWPKAVAAMAAMAPLLPIGGKHRYHAGTYGLIVGGVLEKATQRPMLELLQEEVLKPLGITDFFYGMPDSRLNDLAPIVLLKGAEKIGGADDARLRINDRRALQGVNPSSNATSSAHALARIYASLLENGVDGVRLLQDSTLERALTFCRADDDPIDPDDPWSWDKFGLGYALCGPEKPWNRIFGHGGACGSEGFADRETGYAVGFTKNQLNTTHPVHPVRDAISDVLDLPHRIW